MVPSLLVSLRALLCCCLTAALDRALKRMADDIELGVLLEFPDATVFMPRVSSPKPLRHRCSESETLGSDGVPVPEILGIPHVCNPGGNPADDAMASDAYHIHLVDPPLVLPEAPLIKFARRSRELMAYSRAKGAAKVARRRETTSRNLATTAVTTLDLAVQTLPGFAQLVGRSDKSINVGKIPIAKLKSHQLHILTRAIHMPSKSNVQLGIKHKRLICAGAKLLLNKQRCGFEKLVRSSAAALSIEGASSRFVHLQYSHLWDEVNCKFKKVQAKRLREARSATNQQIIVQRGSVAFTLGDVHRRRARQYFEPWLCQPRQVRSTDAASLMPAVLEALPPMFHMLDLATVSKLSKSVSSATVVLLGDKASANLLMMKQFGQRWEEEVHPFCENVLLWMESCGVHLHHRTKLLVRPLKHHVSRHYSIASLFRLNNIQSQMIKNLELQVPGQVQRLLQKPPTAGECKASLAILVDILYDSEAAYHKRGTLGRKSQWTEDLEALCNMLNACLLDSRGWLHCCWREKDGRPCCVSTAVAAEKTFVALTNVLMRIDPVPAESRWTNTLTNFRKTIMRRICYRAGTSCFRFDTVEGAEQIAVDGEALDNYMEVVRKTRIRRTQEYFKNDKNIWELVVLTCLLDAMDTNLLYPMFGDVEPKDEDDPGKLPRLLSKSESLIGKAGQQLLNLLHNWSRGGSTRRPWALLDAVEAPLSEQWFMRWARGQILRMCAAYGRRYEGRFSSFPYLLFQIASPEFSDVDKAKVVQKNLEAKREGLDSYTFGVRQLYRTADGLLSWKCKQQLLADFRGHPYGIDAVERLNSELTALHPRRAPARNFVNAARESTVSQAANAHRGRGGCHPLSPQSISSTQSKKEIVVVNPLINLCDVVAEDLKHAEHIAMSCILGPQSVLEHQSSSSRSLSTSFTDGKLDIVSTREVFGEEIRVQRPTEAFAVVAVGPSIANDVRVVARSGLSPFMLERNRHMQKLKEVTGRKLQPDEQKAAMDDFRAKWDLMPDHGVFNEAYEEWRYAKIDADTAKGTSVEYRPLWGGGCSATPVTSQEMMTFLRLHGWRALRKPDTYAIPTNGVDIQILSPEISPSQFSETKAVLYTTKNRTLHDVEPTGCAACCLTWGPVIVGVLLGVCFFIIGQITTSFSMALLLKPPLSQSLWIARTQELRTKSGASIVMPAI
jgi:hypothetical protein